MAQADFMVSTGLAALGYEYINVRNLVYDIVLDLTVHL